MAGEQFLVLLQKLEELSAQLNAQQAAIQLIFEDAVMREKGLERLKLLEEMTVAAPVSGSTIKNFTAAFRVLVDR